MMLLVHCAPSTLEKHRHPNLGVLCSPRVVYGDDIEGWRWAADNDAYSNWDEDRYRRMLDRIYGRKNCLFVTAPDVVGDATRTRAQFDDWYELLHEIWQPIGYVIQDGQTDADMPWGQIDAVFIGGTSEWKMGGQAALLARQALNRGLWLHMGRVNTQQRVRYAKALGCNSIDGTAMSWFRDTYLDRFLQHAASEPQMLLGHE